MLVDERWFQTYLTDKLGFVKDSYVRQTIDDGLIDLLYIPAEKYTKSNEMEYGGLVVVRSER